MCSNEPSRWDGMLKRTISLRRSFWVPTTQVLVAQIRHRIFTIWLRTYRDIRCCSTITYFECLYKYWISMRGSRKFCCKMRNIIWAMIGDFQQCGMCDQQGLRSACAYVQSDQSLCLSLEYSMSVKLLTEHHLEFLSLRGGYTGPSESTLVKIPHCWKSHVAAHFNFSITHSYLDT